MDNAAIFDLNQLLTYWNVLLMFAVWSFVQALRCALAPYLTGDAPLTRLVPLAPMLLCSIAVWIPGPWLSPDETAGQRVVLGLVLGALTANLHTIASRLGLHELLGIEPDTSKKPPATP